MYIPEGYTRNFKNDERSRHTVWHAHNIMILTAAVSSSRVCSVSFSGGPGRTFFSDWRCIGCVSMRNTDASDAASVFGSRGSQQKVQFLQERRPNPGCWNNINLLYWLIASIRCTVISHVWGETVLPLCCINPPRENFQTKGRVLGRLCSVVVWTYWVYRFLLFLFRPCRAPNLFYANLALVLAVPLL